MSSLVMRFRRSSSSTGCLLKRWVSIV
uniref:Uncharacterized protein n=1 Tax=Arundo donax TaxID=35708 RepID=A0A0A8Y301_ARUDO